jgi:predicted ATPase
MITRLEVDGFKSLRGLGIDLAPFTALIGPNSAGKSNILEAIALLSHLAAEPIEAAFKHGRGRAIDQFTLEKGEPVAEIRLAVELLLPVDVAAGDAEATNRVRYELTIRRQRGPSGAEALVVAHERLSTIAREKDGWIEAHPELLGRARYASEERELLPQVDSPKDFRRGERRVRVSWGSVVATELSAARFVHLDATRMRDESERIGGAALAPDASNLPTVLAALSPRLLGEIRADLVALVPGISTLHIVADKDVFRIDIELSDGERLPARLVSDGTLRALALLTALRSSPSPSIIAIEEPENGIYPGRLRALIEVLREASCLRRDGSGEDDPREEEDEEPFAWPPQIMITSHSPVVLAAMRDDTAGLRFIDTVRRDGHLVTRARRIGPSLPGERGQHSVPLREVDALLALATSEAAE